MVIGLSNIDIFTGKSSIFEYEEPFSKYCTSYDELERYISIYNPSEVIIIHNLDDSLINNIINYASITTECIHKINLNIEDINSSKANNCEKQIYQKQIITKFYEESTYSNNYNFLTYQTATQSFCYLLEFVYEHNPNLVSKIVLPMFENCGEKLLLGNHSLKQLNIINYGMSSGKMSSIADFINICVTPMGKRQLKQLLVNPIYNNIKLEKEYNIIEYLNNHIEIKDNIRTSLKTIKDIEKLSRKLQLKRITPQDLYYLYNNIESIKLLYGNYVSNDTTLNEYIHSFISQNISDASDIITKILSDNLKLESCKDINNLDYDNNFIKNGVNTNYDQLVTNWHDSLIVLEAIKDYLNNLVKPFEKRNRSNNPEYIKIYKTDKMGYSIVATKRRITILKEELKKSSTDINITYTSWTGVNKTFVLNIESLTYNKSTAANFTISNEQISNCCKSILTSQREVSIELEKIYNNIILKLITTSAMLEEIIMFISIIDTVTTKSHISIKYKYTKPIIDMDNDNSYIDIKELRHPLIEALLEEELYVTNDIILNNKQLGILLYGTNAVGKSSFIKSIGICIIMAQAGFLFHVLI